MCVLASGVFTSLRVFVHRLVLNKCKMKTIRLAIMALNVSSYIYADLPAVGENIAKLV